MPREFTTWADELERWKAALASREIKQFFLLSTENRNEMRTVYTRLDNVTKFTEWLEQKAALEAVASADGGEGSGSIFMSVGGA